MSWRQDMHQRRDEAYATRPQIVGGRPYSRKPPAPPNAANHQHYRMFTQAQLAMEEAAASLRRAAGHLSAAGCGKGGKVTAAMLEALKDQVMDLVADVEDMKVTRST